ncbi:hypothetical protein [Prosthecobacter sp.]|uniref:hypothetical protein n=1 Tax=Prosthecobacter sp. TaxID=1965333 RepID=UPI0037CA130F
MSLSALATLLSPCQLDAIHTSTSDTGVPLEIPGLEEACGLLGGTHAWVTRHRGNSCQLVNLLGSAIEIDSTLNALLVHSAQNSLERPVLLLRWKDKTHMCARLSTQQEADGCTYMLSMLFDGQFELTSRLAGFVDGLRCSMQALISWQLSKQSVELAQASGRQTISCTCCHRYHSFEHGWMHWDHQSNLRDVQGTFRTVCEKCALALYSVVLQDQA